MPLPHYSQRFPADHCYPNVALSEGRWALRDIPGHLAHPRQLGTIRFTTMHKRQCANAVTATGRRPTHCNMHLWRMPPSGCSGQTTPMLLRCHGNEITRPLSVDWLAHNAIRPSASSTRRAHIMATREHEHTPLMRANSPRHIFTSRHRLPCESEKRLGVGHWAMAHLPTSVHASLA